MPSTIDKLLFNEPAGRPNSVIQFAGAVVFLALYVYSATRGAAVSGRWLLVMAFAAALSAGAESCPKDRRRLAGVLRITAILALVCLLAVVVVAPNFALG